jgi:predicted nucleic acid-binding protein
LAGSLVVAPKKPKKNPRKPKRAIVPVLDKAIAVTVIVTSAVVVQTIARTRKLDRPRALQSRIIVAHLAHHVMRIVTPLLNVQKRSARLPVTTAVTLPVAAVVVVVTVATSQQTMHQAMPYR